MMQNRLLLFKILNGTSPKVVDKRQKNQPSSREYTAAELTDIALAAMHGEKYVGKEANGLVQMLPEFFDEDDFSKKSDYIKSPESYNQEMGLTMQEKKDKILLLFTKDDPMRDYFGSASESHPNEIAQIAEHLSELGVEIVYSKNKMAYQPNVRSGSPGRIVIDPEASYGAWKHEEQHALDDYASGWKGFRLLEDPIVSAHMEEVAYDIEIAMAKEANLDDLVNQLEILKKKSMEWYN